MSRSGASWLFGVPWGIRKVLRWIKNEYDNPPVIITENGFAEVNPANTKDPERINWLRQYIDNVLKGDDQNKITSTVLFLKVTLLNE
jgi:beta-glucosidase/6-phospho-beta-glucosidase/beta-galactosidase